MLGRAKEKLRSGRNAEKRVGPDMVGIRQLLRRLFAVIRLNQNGHLSVLTA